MDNQGESSNTREIKVFLLNGVVAAGFAPCAVMSPLYARNPGKDARA